MKDVNFISSDLAFKCANALVSEHNLREGGSVRLFSFRQLCLDLQSLGQQHLISVALKPTDYPRDMWFPDSFHR